VLRASKKDIFGEKPEKGTSKERKKLSGLFTHRTQKILPKKEKHFSRLLTHSMKEFRSF
jgi:hypothetical protein